MSITVKKDDGHAQLMWKLALAREEFHKMELKKTGQNKFAKFDFFELSDFVIPAMKCMKGQGLVPFISFQKEYATMSVTDVETGHTLMITSPQIEAEYVTTQVDDNKGLTKTITVSMGSNLKGCHPIQNVGAVETYQRRYLWVTLMEIAEHDELDGDVGSPDTDNESSATPAARKPAKKATSKKKVSKKPEPKDDIDDWGDAVPDAPAAPADTDDKDDDLSFDDTGDDDGDDDFIGNELVMDDEDDAKFVADQLIQLTDMHETLASLRSFWHKNQHPMKTLQEKFPKQFTRVKNHFSKLKATLEEQENG